MFGLLVFSAGCAKTTTAAVTNTPGQSQVTASPAAPTPTIKPSAATVNGETISIEEYNAELARYQAAQTNTATTLTADEQKTLVIDDLVDQVLLAQAATQEGFSMNDNALQAYIDELANEMGGQDVLTTWMDAQGYTADTFRLALLRSLGAAWKRDQIFSAVPETAEQVHVRQIIRYNQDDADAVAQALAAGADFEEQAYQYDPVGGGDLGWFPKGYLPVSEVDDAAFSYQVGEISPVIKSSIGYHIIQVLDKKSDQPLTTETRIFLQKQALANWLADAKTRAQISITLP